MPIKITISLPRMRALLLPPRAAEVMRFPSSCKNAIADIAYASSRRTCQHYRATPKRPNTQEHRVSSAEYKIAVILNASLLRVPGDSNAPSPQQDDDFYDAE